MTPFATRFALSGPKHGIAPALRRGVMIFVLLLSACIKVDTMRIDTTPRPATSPARVQVLVEAPSTSYKTIALVDVSHEDASLEELKGRLVEEAARLGGEGVIISRRDHTGVKIIPIGKILIPSSTRVKVLVGQVIVFEQH